jgi:hypothetical protein
MFFDELMNAVSGLVSSAKDKLGWYEDDDDLLKDFFEQDRLGMIDDLQALHHFTKQNHTKMSELLIQVLSPLQSPIIIDLFRNC